MLITPAFAQDADLTATIEVPTPGMDPAVTPPSAGEAFAWNMGLILLLVVLFYVLLIRPQQKRFKEHQNMLSDLKKGDEVVTSGGLIGKVDTIEDDKIIVDLGDVKVTAVKSTIQSLHQKEKK